MGGAGALGRRQGGAEGRLHSTQRVVGVTRPRTTRTPRPHVFTPSRPHALTPALMAHKQAASKAASVADNSKELRKSFQLPTEESCIQKYACAVSGFNRGTLYVSQNYLCWSSKVNDRSIRLPFSQVKALSLGSGLLSKQITVQAEGKSYTFSDFNGSHGKECYNLLEYLWGNPVTYVEVAALDAAAAKAQVSNNSNQSMQTQRQRPKIDTQAADELLRIASETDAMQNAAMEQVSRQGEQLDRIEGHLDRMDHALGKADHLMKGIESMRYYMFGGKGKKWQQERAQQLHDRSLRMPPDRPKPCEIEVLYKKESDHLVPALLVMDDEQFKVIDPVNDTLIVKGAKYAYRDMVAIVLRARHEHLDVRLPSGKKDATGRLRIMSSYLQVITTQLYTRAKRLGHTPEVVFEPGVRHFSYTDERVSAIQPVPRQERARATTSTFVRPNMTKTSDLLTESSPETRADMQRVEAQLDQVHVLAQGITAKAHVLNSELDRQNEQLGRIDGKVDEVQYKTSEMNKRMGKQLK